MTLKAEVLDALLASGATAEMIVAAVKADAALDHGRLEAKRAANAERQRRFKEKRREGNAGNALPSVINVTSVTEAPAPNKAPQTPKINPTPHGGETPAREHAHEATIPGPQLPSLVVLQLGAFVAAITAGRDMALQSLWNGMPPPATITDETWSGWLAHRKAMPKAAKFTPYAYGLFCKRLAKIAADTGMPPGALIDLAIVSNWQTIHPPKDSLNDRFPARRSDRPSAWAPRPDIAGQEPAYLDD